MKGRKPLRAVFLTMNMVIYLDNLLLIFIFQLPLRRLVAVTSQPFVVQDCVVPHLNNLVHFKWEPEAQGHNGYFIMYNTLLKMGVVEEKYATRRFLL